MNLLGMRQVAVVLAVAAIGATGCGGSNSSHNKPASAASGLSPSTATTAGASGTGFVAQVKVVCRRANVAASSADGNASKLAAVLDRYLPDFRSISAPASLQPAYAQLLSNLSKISAALKRNDIAAVKRLENQDHPLASKLGIRHCAG